MTALVSVLIPAYNERHFGSAFASALAQTHPWLEIVVCDDSPGESIGAVVRAANDPRVRYERNPERLGFGPNFSRCLALARGEFVKFLNDDDVLHPECVATFAGAFERHPQVTLATSRRMVIDGSGNVRGDIPATTPLSFVSGVMPGLELGDFALTHSVNFIGEPTTAMFRRTAIVPEADALFRWRGRDYHCLADLSLWLRLLANGAAYYHADALSHFRIHTGQEQHKSDVNLLCLLERLWILEPARGAGFLADRRALCAALERIRVYARSYQPSAQIPADWREALEREVAAASC